MTLLTPRDYTILGLVGSNPGICRKALADIYGIKSESASIGTALQRLVVHGCITKDRRAVGIQRTAYNITDKGKRVLEAVAALEAVQ